jgi:hypothetical protein
MSPLVIALKTISKGDIFFIFLRLKTGIITFVHSGFVGLKS